MATGQTAVQMWPLLRLLPAAAVAFAIIAKGLSNWANGKPLLGGSNGSDDPSDGWFGSHHGDGGHDGCDDGGGGDGGH